jgi:acyl dehydratase
MHGTNNFGLISRMITDWAYPAGAIHRRLETRWIKPVGLGDTIQPTGIVKSKQATANSRWVLIDLMVRNQNDEKVATGEAGRVSGRRRGVTFTRQARPSFRVSSACFPRAVLRDAHLAVPLRWPVQSTPESGW